MSAAFAHEITTKGMVIKIDISSKSKLFIFQNGVLTPIDIKPETEAIQYIVKPLELTGKAIHNNNQYEYTCLVSPLIEPGVNITLYNSVSKQGLFKKQEEIINSAMPNIAHIIEQKTRREHGYSAEYGGLKFSFLYNFKW